MSVSFSCKCNERKKPLAERRWVVRMLHESRSAFNGYRSRHSAYSEVQCLNCGALGRTKARYVDLLKFKGWTVAQDRKTKSSCELCNGRGRCGGVSEHGSSGNYIAKRVCGHVLCDMCWYPRMICLICE